MACGCGKSGFSSRASRPGTVSPGAQVVKSMTIKSANPPSGGVVTAVPLKRTKV